MSVTVKSSFWRPQGHPDHNSHIKEFYTYHSEPELYKGFEIYCVTEAKRRGDRILSGQYDVVKNGVCIAQRVTMNAAKSRCDELLVEIGAFEKLEM